MTESSDTDLLARIRSGDDSALDTLLARYETPVFQFLVGILRDHHRAEDAREARGYTSHPSSVCRCCGCGTPLSRTGMADGSLRVTARL